MPSPGFHDQIVQRIKNTFEGQRHIAPEGDILIIDTPDIVARCRRAKLLVRNEKFSKELKKILDEMAMHRRSLKEAKKESAGQSALQRRECFIPSPDELAQQEPEWIMFESTMPWQDFCYRWGVSDHWWGELDALDCWAIGEAEIFFRKPSGRSGSVPLGCASAGKQLLLSLHQNRGERWAENVAKESAFIYLKISPETHLEDLKKFWPWMENLKKQIWGFSERAKQTFERDLCFWDLKNKPEEYGKLSFGGILDRWNKNGPADQKVKNTDVVKKAVKLIQTYIDRLTPIGG